MGCKYSSVKCDDPSALATKNGGDIIEGELLDDFYKVDVKMLGSGSYAKVYRAVEKQTRQVVAVKRIDKETSRRELLDTEICIMRRFGNHKHIVRMFACFETQAEVQLVMEFMAGGELFDVLAEVGPYGEVQAAEHVKAIASALEHLHRNNVAHRDLKPENLLLTAKPPAVGLLKICDFGLALMLKENDVMTRPCGTWAYCAPEVLRIRKIGTGSYNIKCDMFAVGVLVFVILSGYHPFDVDGRQSEKQMQEHIIAGSWDFDDPAWEGVSDNAKEVIGNLLEPNPIKRLSAASLVNHPWTSGVSPYGNLSDKIDTEVAGFRLRMRHKKLKAGLIAAQTVMGMQAPHQGAQGKRDDVLRRWELVRSAWRMGELAKLAPLTMTSAVSVAQRQWLRVQNTPAMGSGSRHEVIQKIFKLLDSDRNGRLNGQELYRFARIKGFPGALTDWLQEYRKLCLECGWSVAIGIDCLSFDLLLNTKHCSFHSTRQDLLQMLAQWDSASFSPTSSGQSPRSIRSSGKQSVPSNSSAPPPPPPIKKKVKNSISRPDKTNCKTKAKSKQADAATHREAQSQRGHLLSIDHGELSFAAARSQPLMKVKPKAVVKPKAKHGARPTRGADEVGQDNGPPSSRSQARSMRAKTKSLTLDHTKTL